MPHLDLSPPSKSHITPYINGAGKYPKILLTKFAKAFAYGLSSGYTDVSKIPVIIGNIIPPKNK
jgi:hypothetical protein